MCRIRNIAMLETEARNRGIKSFKTECAIAALECMHHAPKPPPPPLRALASRLRPLPTARSSTRFFSILNSAAIRWRGAIR